MITDIRKGEFGIEGKLYSKVFNTEIEVMIDEEVDIGYAQKCAEHFNNLSSEMVETICRGAKAYCLDFMEIASGDWDEELTIPVTSETPAIEMMKCFKPTMLIIEEPDDENKIGYQLECNCDWEIEHGMEIDILDNKVVYLSSFNAYSPWLEYDTDEYNYVNQI
ncbi:MAG: hypothetical protein K2I80_07780 [Ruminococcus sp.]|nr:hypothetical protein [Ruminococcus sp.]MDE6848177.1 hypothetical protein [Ruminococcus sp.]